MWLYLPPATDPSFLHLLKVIKAQRPLWFTLSWLLPCIPPATMEIYYITIRSRNYMFRVVNFRAFCSASHYLPARNTNAFLNDGIPENSVSSYKGPWCSLIPDPIAGRSTAVIGYHANPSLC